MSNKLQVFFLVVLLIFSGIVMITQYNEEHSISTQIINQSIIYNNTIIYNQTITQHTQTQIVPKFQFVEPSIQCKGKRVTAMEESKVHGHSMQPTIFASDTILSIEYDPKKELVSGDMIIFDNGKQSLHRIIAVYDEYVITQGDYNDVADEWVYIDQIQYVVCGVLRG